MNKERLSREERSAQMRDTSRNAMLAAAIDLSVEEGFANFTRNSVADRAGYAASLVSHTFGSVDALREAVIAQAIEEKNLTIIAQALAAGHPAVQGLSPELKQQAATALTA